MLNKVWSTLTAT